MPPLKLSILSILLGLIFGLPHVYGVLKPVAFGQMMRKFPRYTPLGYLLMLLGTFWFLMNLRTESVSDFIAFKPLLYGLFAAVGVGACVFVQDFLAVRGLAVVFLLLAKLMVDSARWTDSEWRLIIVTWAYLLVVAGMWFTVSPWRLRDLIDWMTATEQRTRLLSGLRVGFGLLLIILGLTTFRNAEKRDAGSAGAGPLAALSAIR
ncbi:MAG TPA: hypothetical protein VGE41_13055 [Verrucomicrobiae bacterium]|jgi:hypothetical protein